jgi:hypothetical protein
VIWETTHNVVRLCRFSEVHCCVVEMWGLYVGSCCIALYKQTASKARLQTVQLGVVCSALWSKPFTSLFFCSYCVMECTLYQVILCAALTSTAFLNVLAILHTTSSTVLCICNWVSYSKSVVRSWLHCGGCIAPACCSSRNICNIKIVWNQIWKSLFYVNKCECIPVSATLAGEETVNLLFRI